MKSKRSIYLFLILFAMLFTSCNSQTNKQELHKNDEYYKEDKTYDDKIKKISDFYEVTQNDNYILYINGLTTEVSIFDKNTNETWYTNPQNRENDTVANGINSELLNSQFIFKYINSKSKSFEMNNFIESIKLGQFFFYPINNGVRVNYVVGKQQKVYLVPRVLSESRYNTVTKKLSESSKVGLKSFYVKNSLKDKLTDSDRAMIQKEYPIIKNTDVYILSTTEWANNSNVSDMLLEMVEKYFIEAGYTLEDLEKDEKDSGMKLEEKDDFSLRLSIEYTIDNNGLSVCVPKDSIVYDENVMKLYEISLLPFFGAEKAIENGYMFIPDGSGALINLKSDNRLTGEYKKTIFGQNKAILEEKKEDTGKYPIYLPVFGIKNERAAFLAVVNGSETEASIQANVSGLSSEYNQVYSIFTLRHSGKQEASVMNIGGALKYQDEPLSSDLKLSYLFTEKEKSDYVGMALRYQKYLLDNGELNKVALQDEKLPVSIEVIGAITYDSTFFGIPIKKQISLTSYNQLIEIIKKLKEKGLDNVLLSYNGWGNGGVNNSLTSKVKYVSKLGGEKGYRNLINYANSQNIDLYPDVNFQYLSEKKNFDGFSLNRDAIRDVAEMVAYDYTYNIATNYRIKNKRRIILSPKAIDKNIDSFLKSFGKNDEKSIGISNFGTDLNGDYRGAGKNTDRQQAKEIIINKMEELSKSYKVMVSGANSYTFAFSSLIRDIPLTSSQHFIFDRSVPFYSIVLHGYIPYTTEPLNTSADLQEDTLLAIESGAIPGFRFTKESNYLLKQTDYQYFSVNFEQWKETAVKTYDAANNALASCQASTITAHQIIRKGLVKVEYSNKTVIYINYNEKAETVEGFTVEPKNYIVSKGVA